MSRRLFPVDDPAHRAATDLLPWYANATLEAEEHAQVEQHLLECAACKRDVDEALALQTALRADDTDPGMARGLERLRRRLHAERPQPGRRQWPQLGAMAARWLNLAPWTQGALAAQWALIAVLAGVLIAQPDRREYHTLAATEKAAGPSARLLVVFDGARPQRDVERLLQRLQARIVDGPGRAGDFTLQVPAAAQAKVLDELRHDALVRLAEPTAEDQRRAR